VCISQSKHGKRERERERERERARENIAEMPLRPLNKNPPKSK
jgi:hypothetical protein